MSRGGEPDAWRHARSLLAVSRSNHSPSLLLPAAVALTNLFFCAFFENPIKDDPDGRTLSLFLFIQGSAILILTLAHLASTGAELLRKSLVMPVTPAARLAFAALSSARQPVLLAMVLSDVFFLLVLYHQSIAAFLLIPLLAALMAADIIALTALASVAAIRRSRPPTILAAYCILGILGIVLLALVFRMPASFGVFPPMSWTARGITAIAAGETGMALFCGSASVAVLIVTGVAGRRII